MNVNTIQIPYHVAIQKLNEYAALKQNQRTAEDSLLLKTYKAVENGARVIDIAAAFKQTGLNELGQPRLAIARADGRVCYFHARAEWSRVPISRYRPGFTIRPQYDREAKRHNVTLPASTFDGADWFRKSLFDKLPTLRAPVPHIPPTARPKYKLENYHILFEVKEWESYPVDPFLLKRISSTIFVVLAEWELTDLEASILGALNDGQ